MFYGQFSAAAPEITLLIMICVVLIADLFVKDEDRAVTYWLSLIALALTGWSLLVSAPDARTLLLMAVMSAMPCHKFLKSPRSASLQLVFFMHGTT